MRRKRRVRVRVTASLDVNTIDSGFTIAMSEMSSNLPDEAQSGRREEMDGEGEGEGEGGEGEGEEERGEREERGEEWEGAERARVMKYLRRLEPDTKRAESFMRAEET